MYVCMCVCVAVCICVGIIREWHCRYWLSARWRARIVRALLGRILVTKSTRTMYADIIFVHKTRVLCVKRLQYRVAYAHTTKGVSIWINAWQK